VSERTVPRITSPRILLQLLEAQADALRGLIDLEHDALDLLAFLHDLRGVLGLAPAHLADVDQAFDALLHLHERAVVGDRHDLARDAGADRVARHRVLPRVFLGLLQAERDALGLGVVAEHLHGDLVADLEDLRRVVHAAPAHVRDVQQSVDAAEIHERAVLGDVLDRAGDDHALFEALQGLRLELVALLLEQHAAREHDVAALLVELDDLELEGLADQLVEVAHGAQVDLRARQERLDAAADRDLQAALHARGDRAFDQLVALARGADLVPHLELVGLLLGERDQSVLGFTRLDQYVDHVARLDADFAGRVDELVCGDDAFGLVTDVDHDRVAVDLDHGALNDFAFAQRVGVLHRRVEQASERLLPTAGTAGGGGRLLCTRHTCGKPFLEGTRASRSKWAPRRRSADGSSNFPSPRPKSPRAEPEFPVSVEPFLSGAS